MSLDATAQLRGVITLDDRMSGPLRRLNGVVGGLRGGFTRLQQGIGTGLRNAAIIGGGGLAILTSQIKAGLDSLIRLDSLQRQTNAVLRSTGGVSGQTAAGIRALAEELEDLTTVDDKQIQAASNMLLTFTNIRGKALPEATKAVVDLAVAMAELNGTEVDLSAASIQIGKALQDPVRGVTALRRVGVVLSEQQEERIKALIKEGDLYGAQRIILKELATEFGGAGGAYGTGTAASIRRVQDAIEDAQKALSTAFLPVLERVSGKLQEFLKQPATLAGLEDVGEQLAGLFSERNIAAGSRFVRDVWDKLKEVPWGTIADGLRIAGQAAKVAVDAFLSLPPNVQGALITLLAANKLTGGLVSATLGGIASFVLQSLGGRIFAANVTVVGGNVVGGATGAGGGGAGLGLLGGAFALAAVAGIELAVADALRGPLRQAFGLDPTGTGGTSAQIGPITVRAFEPPIYAKVREELMKAAKQGAQDTVLGFHGISNEQTTALSNVKTSFERESARQVAQLQRLRDLQGQQQRYLAIIAAKPSAPTVTVNNRTYVDGRLVAYTTSQINATGTYSTRQTYAA